MASGSKTVIYAALIGNAAIAVTKFAASLYTGSSAMLTEAIHSLVDTGNQVLLLHGLRRAQKPASPAFPFGHGKEIYFWSFIVAMLIFALGAGISIYEGIKHLLHPKPVTSPMVNYIVLAAAIVFEGGAWFYAWKQFKAAKGEAGYFQAVREGKDPTMFVVLFEDTAALLGLFVALVAIWLGQVTGNVYFDGGASVIIGLILAAAAVMLAWETKGLLIGESASAAVQQAIGDLVRNHPDVQHINELLTMHLGPENILVTMSVDFDDRLPAEDVKDAVDELNRRIRDTCTDVRRVFIEVESPEDHARQRAGG